MEFICMLIFAWLPSMSILYLRRNCGLFTTLISLLYSSEATLPTLIAIVLQYLIVSGDL